MNRIGDLLLGLWFLLIAVAFWGPYFGVGLPPNIGTALYALMLLAAIAALVLRFLRSGEEPSATETARSTGTKTKP
jgi:apolipoprotein N-acyltransferase